MRQVVFVQLLLIRENESVVAENDNENVSSVVSLHSTIILGKVALFVNLHAKFALSRRRIYFLFQSTLFLKTLTLPKKKIYTKERRGLTDNFNK